MSERYTAELVRWEYKSTKQISDGMLNAYGRDGWELVQIEHGFAFFKRPLIDGSGAGK